MKPIYVAITSFKGGTGCSTLTVLLASRLHYELNKRVAIIDCDPLQHFCSSLRTDEVRKKSEYPIIESTPSNALSDAQRLPEETEFVFFDIPKSGCFSLMWSMDIVYLPIEESMISCKWLKNLFQMVYDVKEKGSETMFRAFLTRCTANSTTRLWNIVTMAGVGYDVKILIMDIKIPEKKYFTMKQIDEKVCVSTEQPIDFSIVKKICIGQLENDLIKKSKLLINYRNKVQ